MTVPRSETRDRPDDGASAPHAAAVPWSGTDQVRLAWEPADDDRAFALCVRGEVRADPLPPSLEAAPAPSSHAADARVLTGRVDGEAVEVVVDGELLAASFEAPAPTLWIGDDAVEPGAWPPVEGVDVGAPQEPVADPFPERGMLGKPLGDPLDPKRYVVELDASAAEEPGTVRLEVDGDVEAAPDAVSVAPVEDDGGCGEGDPDAYATATLAPGETVSVEVRGQMTWIERDRGVDVTVRQRD